MGVLFSKINVFHKSEQSPPRVTTFSWDDRASSNLSPRNYLVDNIKDGIECRTPGTINGQQFVIQNCSRSKIFIFDYSDTVIVDECDTCTMILGPVKRSIFMRDCINCRIIVACEQFRLRDCINLEVSLYCATVPIIESSKDIKFSCFQLCYNNIQEHFRACSLNTWNNMWYKVHDYTPANKNDYPNWDFGGTDIVKLLHFPPEIQKLDISTNTDQSIVPLTSGMIHNVHGQRGNCLVIFCDDFSARSFLKLMHKSENEVVLIKSRQIEITVKHAESLFLTSKLIKAVQHSPVIGLHMHGNQAINTCSRMIAETIETTLYYVSPTTNMASHQVNTFFSIADLQRECCS